MIYNKFKEEIIVPKETKSIKEILAIANLKHPIYTINEYFTI